MSGPGEEQRGTAAEGGEFVDWGLAERLALMVARSDSRASAVGQEEIDRAADGTVGLVCEYTGLEVAGELPRPEAVDRPAWVEANLAAIRGMSGELERRLAASLRMPEPLGGLARTVAGTAAGAEAGLALGFLARKVLGQYDVALIGPTRAPRLLFVGPNLAEAERRLGAERELFLRWIALHEATHAVQFAAVPWLREHLGSLVEELMRGASLRPELRDVRNALARMLSPPDPRRLAEHLREEGLISLLAGPDQLHLLRRLQATMAVIEGYSEHVMDAIGERLDPRYSRLRELIEANRERQGLLDAIVARLLGLEGKLRQYRVGKRFADGVAEREGIERLNDVWAGPEALPDPEELEDPERWLARVRPAAAACNQSPPQG